jgi:modification target Cys-rich repeat protein
VEVTASAAVACDATLDPGSAEVRCEGSCSIDASAQAECSASGTLRCKGPRAACEGTCSGSCDLAVAAACDGTCRGTCNGTCSVRDGNDNCAGQCEGTCQGSCELSAGGSCSGTCQGSCEIEAASCEAGFEARCEAGAEADIQCRGGCEGEVRPPEVSAECEATVQAKAQASVECAPPSVDISWQWNAAVAGDLQAQAEFKAWIGSAKARLGGLLAAAAKAEGLGAVGVSLRAAAEGAVKGAVNDLSGSADLKASIGAGCALTELPDVASALGGSIDGVLASGAAIGEIVLAFGG